MSKQRTSIPDLRAYDNEFTLEHCSVIQRKLGEFLDDAYGPGHSTIADQFDTPKMLKDLLAITTGQRLNVLFRTQFGKGLIVGLFYAKVIQPLEVETEEEDETF